VFIREPDSRARPRTSSRRWRPGESSRRRCATPSTTGSPLAAQANKLIDWVVDRAPEASACAGAGEGGGAQKRTRKLRLPGKLADCTNAGAAGLRLFIVEGDSGRRLAKQGRGDRATSDPPRCAARS
jgi:topoisomerase-4 subunit B